MKASRSQARRAASASSAQQADAPAARAWLCTVHPVRHIPNQPSQLPGSPLVLSHCDVEFQEGELRASSISVLFTDGFGEVVGEWGTKLTTAPLSTPPSAQTAQHPTFSDIGWFLAGALQNRVFVSHDIETPLQVLAAEFARARITQPQFSVIDTRDLAQRLVPGLRSYSLDALCAYFSIDEPSAPARLWALLSHLQALDPHDLTAELRLVAAPTPVSPAPALTLDRRQIVISGMLPHRSEDAMLQELQDRGAAVSRTIAPGADFVLLALNYDPAIAQAAVAAGMPFLGVEWYPTLLSDPEYALQHLQFDVPRSVTPHTSASFKRHRQQQS